MFTCFHVGNPMTQEGLRVRTDIFHVPVPGLFGATEPYHLIAFKEDYESRAQPDAQEDWDPQPPEMNSRCCFQYFARKDKLSQIQTYYH